MRSRISLLLLLAAAGCNNGSSTDAGMDSGAAPEPVDPTACLTAASCPGSDTECATRTCVAGRCGQAFADAGTRASGQVVGDCKVRQCDGLGGINTVTDGTDQPFTGPCTTATCVAGSPVYTSRDAGAACGNGLSCDGRGLCVGCLTAAACPGMDTACATRACVSGVCRFTFTAPDAAVPTQTAGDCRENRCDGDGGVVAMPLDSDRPNDGNVCTDDLCAQGQPRHPAKSPGTSCSLGGDVCDGDGGCVQCVSAASCPGVDGECAPRSCVAGRCGFGLTSRGTPTTNQTSGDCQQRQCDGDGGVMTVAFDSDVRDGGGACTTFGCSGGSPTSSFTDAGIACGTNLFCDGLGACFGCSQPSDCPGTDSECRQRTCTAGQCGFSAADAGFVVSAQTAGDCQERRCDGLGGITNAALDSDTPDAGACRTVSCSMGSPSFMNRALGFTCSEPDGGAVCNASGACVQCNQASDCPTSTNACSVPACVNNVCTRTTPGTTQACGDAGVCNGQGACVTDAVRYTTHAQAIYQAKCAPCHMGSGSGGHNIATTYADSQLPSYYCPGKTKGACTLVRILEGSMPAGAGCTGNPALDASNGACLTAAQQATLAAWIDGGQLQ